MNNRSLPDGFCPPYALAGLDASSGVAVAFSGGADSVALLHMLATTTDATLTAVHVHHGIRGEEADRDAAFCERFAAALQIPFTLIRVDVPALAAQQKSGLETAAREARYEALCAYLEENKIPLLATAHHADDQLETVLQNLLRGSGLRGLCGIPACRPLGSALVTRPLLRLTKAQLLEYCAQNKLEYVTDSTNAEGCCPRNRLRLEVLPVLEEIRHGASAAAARCAASLAEDEAYLWGEAQRFLANEGSSPRISALAALPSPILARVMQQLLPTPPEAAHVRALERLITDATPHASLSLPGVRACIVDGKLTLLPAKKEQLTSYKIPLSPGENPLPSGLGCAFLCTPEQTPPANNYRYAARIDFSVKSTKGTLCVRNRLPGERILHGGVHKLLRKLPCMHPFSREQRALMPLLCDGDGVIGVPFGPVRDGASKKTDMTLHLYFD